MTVLIAEDDRVHSHLLVQRLKAEGIQTTVAYDAMQAVMVASRTLPAAILLDINMPGGTGLEVLKRLKASTKTCNIPVITFSGTIDPNLPTTVRELGAEEFIPKPVEFEKLFLLLCSLIQPATPTARALQEKGMRQ